MSQVPGESEEAIANDYLNSLFSFVTTTYQLELDTGLHRSEFQVLIKSLIDHTTCFIRLLVYPASAERNLFRLTEILRVTCMPQEYLLHSGVGGEAPSPVLLYRDNSTNPPVENFVKLRRQLRQHKTHLTELVERWTSQKSEILSIYGSHSAHSFGRIAIISGVSTMSAPWSHDITSILRAIVCNDILILIEMTGRHITAIQKKLSGSYVTQSGHIVEESPVSGNDHINPHWLASSIDLVKGYLNLQSKVSLCIRPCFRITYV